MEEFKNYLDQITATTELKEKTKTYVKTRLADQSNQKAAVKNRNWAMKKIIVSTVALAACAVLAVGGYAYCSTAVNYVSFDINPSIELGINAFNKVVSVEAYNDDGSNLILETDVIGMPIKQAINLLVKEAVDQGYMADDGSTVISVTAESDNEDDAADIQEESEDGVSEALLTKNIQAIVYANCSSLELRTKAKELGISPGKYKLIAILCELDPSIDPEDCRNMKITDIIVKANEIISANDNSELIDDSGLQLIVNAANQVMNARNNGNKEDKINQGQQNRNQNANENKLDKENTTGNSGQKIDKNDKQKIDDTDEQESDCDQQQIREQQRIEQQEQQEDKQQEQQEREQERQENSQT